MIIALIFVVFVLSLVFLGIGAIFDSSQISDIGYWGLFIDSLILFVASAVAYSRSQKVKRIQEERQAANDKRINEEKEHLASLSEEYEKNKRLQDSKAKTPSQSPYYIPDAVSDTSEDMYSDYRSKRSWAPDKYSNIMKNASLKSINRFVSIDVETTGLGSNDRVVEFTAIRYVDHKLEEVYSTLINPERDIPKAAFKIHGISNEMVEDAPTMIEVADLIIKFVGSDPLVGHNISFDLRMLYQSGCKFSFEDRKVYDTLSIARRCLECDNYKLTTICSHLGIQQETAHRAESDCSATGLLFLHLFEVRTGKRLLVGKQAQSEL